jgi:4'-phosphopantetheinyl transferase
VNTRVTSFRLPETIADVAVMTKVLSATEQERAQRFQRFPPLSAFVGCRYVLRNQIGECLGCSPCDVSIVIDSNDRPSLTTHLPAFSISHSGEYGVVGISTDQGIGVDFEHRRTLPKAREMAELFLCRGASHEVRLVDESRSSDVFLRYWVRAESSAKLSGRGLAEVVEKSCVCESCAGQQHHSARVDVALCYGFLSVATEHDAPLDIELRGFHGANHV